MSVNPGESKHEVAMASDAMSALKPDWREAKARMTDWWAGRKTDRVPARVTAPRDGAPPRKVVGTHEERYLSPEVVFANLDNELERGFFGGEAFPCHFAYIGAVPMGMFLGCQPEFRPETVWQGRLPFGWDEWERVGFDPANRWWRYLCDLHRTSCERSRGRYLVTAGGGGAVMDIMINLFGHEETLLALAERPKDVVRLRDRMVQWALRMCDEAFAIMAPYQEGNIDWLRLWAPGRYTSIQCDLCLMLSPRMFRELCLEELRQECLALDYSIYHLDGSGAWKHLDALLSIPELTAIQWNPEPAVSSDPLAFAPFLRRVQEAGKKLYLSCSPALVRPLLSTIPREGIFLSVACKTEAQARETLRELEKIGM